MLQGGVRDKHDVLPSIASIRGARAKLYRNLPDTSLGASNALGHIASDLIPALPRSSQSSRYYGFVTGGVTPAALEADKLVAELDQNVAVHLPEESIATELEDAALCMLCEILEFDASEWQHKTFTTGATASNILGMAIGREAIIERATRGGSSVARDGLVEALRLADVHEIKVLTCAEHSSLRKACSVAGLGHASVINIGAKGEVNVMDLKRVEAELAAARRRCIIAISCAEVNTGYFGTKGKQEMEELRRLADKYGAWIHVDAAFGLMARVLPDVEEFAAIKKGVTAIELADSIAGDAHKLFNVPYECGFFLSKRIDLATQVFQNPGAPYLSTAANATPSPLNIGIENSRRFRALPVYASLLAYGRLGYQEMMERQVRFARRIAQYVLDSPEYELLPASDSSPDLTRVYIVVLFRARKLDINSSLTARINEQRTIYCSGTVFEGKPATRFAISNWQVSLEHDWLIVKQALDGALADEAGH